MVSRTKKQKYKFKNILNLILVSLLSAALAYISSYFFHSYQVYPELIAGLPSFTNLNKSFELSLIRNFTLSFLLLYLLFNRSKIFHTYSDDSQDQVTSITTKTLILLISALSFNWLFFGKNYFYFLGYLTFVSLLLTTKANRISPIKTALVASILALPCFDLINSFLSYESALALPKLSTVESILLVFFIAHLLVQRFASNALPYLFLLYQLILPWLLFSAIRLEYKLNGQTINISPNLFGLICLLIIALGLSYLAFIKLRSLNSSNLLCQSVVLLAFYSALYLPAFSMFGSDDFHPGEISLPWFQHLANSFQQSSNMISVQGLIAFWQGTFNWLFFSGKFESFGYAASVSTALLVALNALLSSRLIGVYWTLAIIPILYVSRDRFYLFLPALLFLAQPELLQRKTLWLILSSFLVWLCFLWNSASAVALAVGLFFPGIIFLVQIFKTNRALFIKTLLGILAIVAVALLIPLTVSVLNFVSTNAPINTLAHGLGLFVKRNGSNLIQIFNSNPRIEGIIFEFLRTGTWVFIFCLACTFLPSAIRRRRIEPSLILLLVVIGSVLTMSTYSLGRVDGEYSWSRTGGLSFLVGIIFIIFALKNFAILQIRIVIALGFILSLLFQMTPFNIINFRSNLFTKHELPNHYALLPDSPPELGKVYLTTEKLAEVTTIRAIFAKLLKPHETYADLTNRQVYYYFNNRPMLLPNPVFILAGKQSQIQALEILEKEQPAVAWLGYAMDFDQTTFANRNYYIFSWFIKNNYRLYQEQGYSFLLSPERYEEIAGKKYNEAQALTELDRLLVLKDYNMTAVSWGRSLASLQKHLIELADVDSISFTNTNVQLEQGESYKPVRNRRSLQFILPNTSQRPEFLSLHLDAPEDFKNTLIVYYKVGSGDWLRYSKFKIEPGQLLIPLGYSSRAQKLGLRAIKLRFDQASDESISLSKFKLYSSRLN